MLSFPRLDELLVCYAEHARTDGLAQIEKLVSECPSQRAAALRARTILTARATADATHLTMLDELIADLPEGDKGYLTQTRKVRERVLAISRHQRYVDSVNRPFFCEQALMGLRAEINAFYAQVGGYREPLATEFRKAAEAWLKLADQQIAEVQGQRRREPTPQVFRAGDPVLRDAEAFVARLDVCGALEHEIMAGPGCSGLLLYGRRRLGKSTVLRNLDGFLPKPVMALVVSMQNPRAFCSEASLAALLGEDIRQIWPGAASLGPEPKDLATLFQFLEACNTRLEVEQRRLVLGVDEFEELDRRVGLKQFTEDLAATLRESVQSHRRIIWVFAGSHHFSELPNVRWSSYLVSLRTIDLPPFSVEETRLLLSQPLKHARSEAARAAVAVFGSGFWGEDGMDRIHVEAGGWPHLVQLIASTVVDLCNTQGKRRADSGVLDEAMAKAVVSGDSVLAELLLYRSGELPAAWAYLSGFRKRDVQPVPAGGRCGVGAGTSGCLGWAAFRKEILAHGREVGRSPCWGVASRTDPGGGTDRQGWTGADLGQRRKIDPAKFALAARLRRGTTLMAGWIARRQTCAERDLHLRNPGRLAAARALVRNGRRQSDRMPHRSANLGSGHALVRGRAPHPDSTAPP